MADTPENTVVVDNPAEKRFEIHVDGALAGVEDYTTDSDVISFNHTEIYPGHEGSGLAAVLVSGALDQLRARNLMVHPVCPYVVTFLGKHPEYQDLVS